MVNILNHKIFNDFFLKDSIDNYTKRILSENNYIIIFILFFLYLLKISTKVQKVKKIKLIDYLLLSIR